MELSTSKKFNLSNVLNGVSWSYELETIEETLVAKYLGVNILIRGRTVLCKYEDKVIKRDLSYAYSILGLFLYCSEASVFRQCV